MRSSPALSGGAPVRTEPQVRAAIAALERRLHGAAASPQARPRLLRELAEAHGELSAGAFRRKVEAEIDASEQRRLQRPARARAARGRADRADQVMRGARDQAIAYHTQLLRQHPQWCAAPSRTPPARGCADEVLHFLSFEHEQNGNRATALRLSRELIAGFPQSKYLPHAHLALGEHAFSEAATDPSKWKDAQRAYERVIAVPPSRNPVASYGRYKLAYVFWNLSDFGKALAQMTKVIELGQKRTSSPNAQALAKSARRDIIPLYALGGNLAEAHRFLRPLSGDLGTKDEKTLAMMRALGQQLTDLGRYRDAIRLYRDLLQRDRGHEGCDDQAGVTFATMASGRSKAEIAAELRQQLTRYVTFSKAKHPAQAKARCARSTGAYLLETAMSWHREAVGSGGARGTASVEVMERAAELYRLVIDHFTDEQIASFGVRVVGQASPRLATIRYAYADLLYLMKKWEDCGPAFDQVAENPVSANGSEAALSAVICYTNANRLERNAQTGDVRQRELAGRQLSPRQQRMFAAFERYLCEIEPPGRGAEALEQRVEAKHARARAYFEAGRFEEAAAAFRDVAIDHPDASQSIDAAQQYVECLEVLASKVRRPQALCFDDLKRDLPTLLELHCTGAKLRDNEEGCMVLTRLHDDLAARAVAR